MTVMSLSDIRLSLKACERSLMNLSREVNSVNFREPTFPKLDETLGRRNLGEVRSRRMHPDCSREWENYLTDSTAYPSTRTIRQLCWEPRIALNELFLKLLKGRELNGAKSLIGLVYSLHSNWNEEALNNSANESIASLINQYTGRSLVISCWKNSIPVIVGKEGPQKLSLLAFNNLAPPSGAFEKFHLSMNSEYGAAMMTCLADNCITALNHDKSVNDYLLSSVLTWEQWSGEELKSLIAKVLVHDFYKSHEVGRQALIAFIKGHDLLGDPRLPANGIKWLGVEERAKNCLLKWLSEGDITFFFDHVIPKGLDRHGRKLFWLQYVSRLQLSRPLLSADAEHRLSSSRAHIDKVSFGKYKDSGDVSAFILHFGTIIVVEFSYTGAIYIYESQVISELMATIWLDKLFTSSDLKKREKAKYWVAHMKGWQSEVANILARHGIRS